jgi:hypothetical protein
VLTTPYLSDEYANLHDREYVESRLFPVRSYVARQAHVCADCDRVIPSGMRYYYAAGINDGEFFWRRSHLHPEDYELTCDEALGLR